MSFYLDGHFHTKNGARVFRNHVVPGFKQTTDKELKINFNDRTHPDEWDCTIALDLYELETSTMHGTNIPSDLTLEVSEDIEDPKMTNFRWDSPSTEVFWASFSIVVPKRETRKQ
jgi:hypothetical protein